MAEGKKSFILYCDWLETFEELTDEEAGRLIKHIFKYVNDKNPEEPDRVTKLLFTPIKNTLKRDLNKWEGLKEDRSNAGKLGNLKRYNPDIYKKVINKKITASEGFAIAETRKDSQSDTKLAVSDSVSVSVSDNNNNSTQLSVEERFNLFWDRYHVCIPIAKTDRASAFKYWKKLKLEEQRNAYRNVELFSKTLKKGYEKKARTYLSDKNFNDEFIDTKSKIVTKDDVKLWVKNHLTYDQVLGEVAVRCDKYPEYNGLYYNQSKDTFQETPAI